MVCDVFYSYCVHYHKTGQEDGVMDCTRLAVKVCHRFFAQFLTFICFITGSEDFIRLTGKAKGPNRPGELGMCALSGVNHHMKLMH